MKLYRMFLLTCATFCETLTIWITIQCWRIEQASAPVATLTVICILGVLVLAYAFWKELTC